MSNHIFNKDFDSIIQKYYILKKYLIDNHVINISINQEVLFFLPIIHKENKNKKLLFLYLSLNIILTEEELDKLDLYHIGLYENLISEMSYLMGADPESVAFNEAKKVIYQCLDYKKHFSDLILFIKDNELKVIDISMFVSAVHDIYTTPKKDNKKNNYEEGDYDEDEFYRALSRFYSSLFLFDVNQYSDVKSYSKLMNEMEENEQELVDESKKIYNERLNKFRKLYK